jgi:hypothetical protein
MSVPPPQLFTWDGEAMRPERPKLADKEFCVGEKYRLGVIEERSWSSHNHFFAALQEAWENLSDEQVERWPTAEHLRKYALIKTGFCEERSVVCSTKAEAERIAAFVKAMNGYCVVLLKEKTVTVYEAKSQSYRAMTRAEFQKSKDEVLNYIASLIDVTPRALEQNAGAHA